MLSIVVDTNQFISAFIYHGMMKSVFDLILDKKLKLFISSDLKKEIIKKLQEFSVDKNLQNEIAIFMETRGILIQPTVNISICRDKEDNFLLELCETAGSHYLITRDKDLLDLPESKWKQTIIIKPEDFLPLLRSRNLL